MAGDLWWNQQEAAACHLLGIIINQGQLSGRPPIVLWVSIRVSPLEGPAWFPWVAINLMPLTLVVG